MMSPDKAFQKLERGFAKKNITGCQTFRKPFLKEFTHPYSERWAECFKSFLASLQHCNRVKGALNV